EGKHTIGLEATLGHLGDIIKRVRETLTGINDVYLKILHITGPNPDAYTSYLKAIVGARTNNASMVISNLADAVKKDNTMAQKALKDVEFSKYVTSSDFLNILK
ncbi:MAG: hypothetical protein IJA00_00660, partial [Bacteroidaceae bacterium]|nr:hypothetical protein [Bacteroidaceae bacterium]